MRGRRVRETERGRESRYMQRWVGIFSLVAIHKNTPYSLFLDVKKVLKTKYSLIIINIIYKYIYKCIYQYIFVFIKILYKLELYIALYFIYILYVYIYIYNGLL